MCGVVSFYPYCAEHPQTRQLSDLQSKRKKGKAAIWRARRIKQTKGHCQRCNFHDPTGKVFELDHIIPLEDNGPDTFENTWLLCKDCHNDKTSAEQTIRRRKPSKPTSQHINAMQQ